jgi:replicative DNA helicase
VLVDYLQAFTPSRSSHGGTREQEVAGMMAEFARIAMPAGADVPIVILSAVKNPNSDDIDPGPPTERDLRDSGMVRFWATTIVLLHRPNQYKLDLPDKSGPCGLYVPKSRLGPTGYREIYFDSPTATFYDRESDKYP